MAISHNPTKTRVFEKMWFREINKRWSEFEELAIEKFMSMNEIQTNKEVGYSAPQLRIYMSFLNMEIERLLLGRKNPLNWQNQYQLESYERGIERTRSSLIQQGANLVPTQSEVMAAQGLTTFTATPSLSTAVASMAPIHQEGLEFLFTRAYESLKGWTDSLSKEVRQITFDALQEGSGISETAKKIRDRVGVSKSRAQLIARTEVIQAYQQASTSEAERASEELGEEIDLRWITARDNRVRHLHSSWHGTIVSPQDNRSRIGKSPYNCRCSQIPVIKGVSDTPVQAEKFTKQRKELQVIEAK